MAEGPSLNQTPDANNTCSCVACDRPDSVDNFVCCDKCDSWWHYSCAGVTDSVANPECDWVCPTCLPTPAKSLSVKTTSTTRQARLELNLQKLRDQRELERKKLDLELEARFMAEKHQLLEQSLAEEEADSRSVRSHRSGRESREHAEKVAEWVKKQAEQNRKKQLDPITSDAAADGKEVTVQSNPAPDEISGNEQAALQNHVKSKGAIPKIIPKVVTENDKSQFIPFMINALLNQLSVASDKEQRKIAPKQQQQNIAPHQQQQNSGTEQRQQNIVNNNQQQKIASVLKQQYTAPDPKQREIIPGSQPQYVAYRQQQYIALDNQHQNNAPVLQQRNTAPEQQQREIVSAPQQQYVGYRQQQQNAMPGPQQQSVASGQQQLLVGLGRQHQNVYLGHPPAQAGHGRHHSCSVVSGKQQPFIEPVQQPPNYVRVQQLPNVKSDQEQQSVTQSLYFVPETQRNVTSEQYPPRSEAPVTHPLNYQEQIEQQERRASLEMANTSTPQPPPTRFPVFEQGMCGQGPTQAQLAARQILSRDLPNFTGNPSDWPVFISNYTYTSQACGYSDGENMVRLQRCLKGAAWEAVRSRLILPASVPHVIEALRLRYGRSDLLIESLAEKVKAAPAPKVDRLDTIIEFGMMVQALCDHIFAANLTDHLANPTLLKDIVGKLPAEYKMRWASHRKNQVVVNLKTLGDFMEEIVADACSVSSYTTEKAGNRERSKQLDRNLVHCDDGGSMKVDSEYEERRCETEHKSRFECSICRKEGHRILDCDLFKSLPIDDRWRRIQSQGLCRTCLFGHGRRTCRSMKRCGIDGCHSRHHPLLHSTSRFPPPNNPMPLDHYMHNRDSLSFLFRIIPVTLYNGDNMVNTFAFLDEGSSLSMLESNLAAKLEVTGYNKPLCLKWTGNVTREEKNSQRVAIQISGFLLTKRFHMNDVATVQSLDLPIQSLSIDELSIQYKHLQGLPIEGYRNVKPELLIGVDNLRLALPLKAREGIQGGPTAVKTRLGWCVYGGQGSAAIPSFNYHVCECGGDRGDNVLDEAVKAYFALEESGVKSLVGPSSEEDERALQILEKTTVRVDDRYESGLLWKYDTFEFPDSFPLAVKRLQCLERRMAKDQELKNNIERQIQEYQDKGYAHRVTEDEQASADPRRTWYLPLGAVTNPKKPGKVRLIWDASAKVDGISLNSVLLTGPDQMTSLPAVLFRFRQHKVAVSADIKEMFHQIRIRPEDQNAQRFLWRSDPTQQPQIFQMDVATFGSTCSPATAQFVKNKNAKMFRKEFPRAAEAIVRCHYVDDYLDSFGNEEEAKRVAAEVRNIHKQGGLEIRNWCSNSPSVLNHLGEKKQHIVKELNKERSSQSERVLGMLWVTETDEFHFPTVMRSDITNLIETNTRPTKRQILRCVMTLFDPLGLLAPYLVFGKILIQDVWRSGIGWDEQINGVLFERWQEWIGLLNYINEVRIARSYFCKAGIESFRNIQIHTFVDASEVAYACVSYLRIINEEGVVEVALVAAKTKVAPLKPMTIPRMELQGCVLGARLTKFITENHSFSISNRYLWTDSTVNLCWIKSDPLKYNPYVKFRLGEIRETTRPDEWFWVPSKQNPADEATKWGTGPHLNVNSIWYSGPNFLRLPEDQWPKWKPVSVVTEELRPCYTHRELIIPQLMVDIDRFSNWNRLVRAMSYVHRFTNTALKRTERDDLKLELLTRTELQQAESTLISMVQWQCLLMK